MSCSASNAHSLPILTRLRILFFSDFIEYLNTLFIFNFLNKLLPSYSLCYFQFGSSHFALLIIKEKLKLESFVYLEFGLLHYTGNYHYSLAYRSTLSWNTLQNYLPIDNFSTISSKKPKSFVRFYFLLSYI